VEEFVRHRRGKDAITGGPRWCGATHDKWDNSFLETLYGHEWELTRARLGPTVSSLRRDAVIPDPFGGPGRKPTMLVTDVALRESPIYADITRRWLDHPEERPEEFAKAWYKLLPP